jgi:hypothetical protein
LVFELTDSNDTSKLNFLGIWDILTLDACRLRNWTMGKTDSIKWSKRDGFLEAALVQ